MNTDFCRERLFEICEAFRASVGVPIMISLYNLGLTVASDEPVSLFCKTVQACNETHRACAASDAVAIRACFEEKRAVVSVCHAGLISICAPILFGGSAVGYISTYNARPSENFRLSSTISSLGVSEEDMGELYRSLPVITENRAKAIMLMLKLVAEYLTASGIPIVNKDANLERVKSYVRENIGKRLTVSDVSRGTNISKSTIYRVFHTHLSCTLSEYVNKTRIETAERLLVGTELSLDEVAERTGFSSTVYFRSVFKRIKGTSPQKYRKEVKQRRKTKTSD